MRNERLGLITSYFCQAIRVETTGRYCMEQYVSMKLFVIYGYTPAQFSNLYVACI